MASQNRWPTVLVVDDEGATCDLYEAWLADYDVRTARNGPGALDAVTEDVRVVLLDRRMPGISGRGVLERIRHAGYDCRIAMVTAVEPDVDLVDLGFDAYLTKPTTREVLLDTVETLLARDEYDENLRELFSLCERRATLRSADADLGEAIDTLNARIEAVAGDLETTVADFVDTDFRVAFRDVAGAYGD